MKKKSTSEPVRRSLGGFFNLRVVIGVFLILASVILALIGFGTILNVSAQANVGSTTAGQNQPTLGRPMGQMTVIPAVHSDLSPPLRNQPVEWPQAEEEREPPVNPSIPFRYKGAPDPVIQSSLWQPLITPPAIPAPVHTWAGMSKPCNGCTDGIPPDTNGAVGKAQYLEMVNDGLQVFDKLTGTSVLGPIPIDSVWFGFRDACRTGSAGDPVVVYDKLADRWVISQFARPTEGQDLQDECIAVSQTGDATGAWYRYDFHVTSLFVDYPKFGVWPDGYYMSANMFIGGAFAGPQAFVFDRAKMLVGDPTATVQTPGRINNGAFFLPSDLDGILPPPPGDPNHFVQVSVQENGPPDEQALTVPLATPTPTATPAVRYKIWAFHVDWANPGNSRFSPEASLPAAGFARLCPDTRACVPQKGTEAKLDGIGDRVMFRNAYRRFPDGRESMLNNIAVSARSVAGIRWFELQRALPGNWAIRQQSTYQPDNTWRWMGSIAADNQGNIGLGFSASSPTIYPQIRYAGRLATDPLNILSGEQHLFDGTGSQVAIRWGDYSDMTIDPVDDCTFYYTNEYYATTSSRSADWQTRIGYLRFSQCTPPQKGTARFIACDRGAPLSKALVLIDGRTYGATLADGTYDAMLPPGSHTYAVSSPAFATQTGNFAITDSQTTLVEVCLGGRAAVADFNGDGHPDFVLRNTSTRQTSIWYLNNNVFIGSDYGPTIPAPWALWGVADFNQDSHPDYGMYETSGDRTAIAYLVGPTVVGAAAGPPRPAGWALVAAADFNGDGYPDYVLYNMNTGQTAIWYLNNNVYIGGAFAPPLPAGWTLIAAADFNGDGHPDYVLYNTSTRQTAIWYLNNNVYIGGAFGPPLPAGWAVVAAADFDGDGHPDYLLYNASTRQTAIWYLNNNIVVNAAFAPTLSGTWSLIAP